ncbi:hypothetical protein HPB48_005308 [Haemaphysalis longicornis]|uniref:Galactosyltransferase N-terminal domain-containing protein n=1 Tax=Haemaphysalis longicornis TaxID=44386 RepID=A0A9J6GGR0_HAELO|nr:hypothetical protein HPB48_005308 [Haemaphysalis longicornis]
MLWRFTLYCLHLRQGLKVTLLPCTCPVGKVPVVREVPDLRSLEALFPDVKPGGRWSPSHCVARHRVAIIVPYRDRLQNLRVFLHHMHQFLRKQELDYAIYVIEQSGQGDFNRAKLLNIGFEIPKKEYDYDCFVFHDVDLIPNYDKNIYACRENPYHLSICLDAQRYKYAYDTSLLPFFCCLFEKFKRIRLP